MNCQDSKMSIMYLFEFISHQCLIWGFEDRERTYEEFISLKSPSSRSRIFVKSTPGLSASR